MGVNCRKMTLLMFILSITSLLLLSSSSLVQAQSPVLVATKVTVPPKLDGQDSDDAWKLDPGLDITLVGGPLSGAKVTMKAVYTDKDIYILAKWPDKTMNIEHMTWVFDGAKWTQAEILEDRFAIHWSMAEPGFVQAGCASHCHPGAKYPDKLPRMHTMSPKEFDDEWHWKSVRSNAMGYVDDKYMDNTVDPKDDEAGHHADGGTRVYSGNRLKDGAPSSIWKTANPSLPPAAPANSARLFLMANEAGPFSPTNPLTGKPWQKGDKVPSAVLREPTGSNADIKVFGAWKEGFWTLEMQRALDTGPNASKNGKRLDVILNPLNIYAFAIAVFDNSEGMDHSLSGLLFLAFK